LTLFIFQNLATQLVRQLMRWEPFFMVYPTDSYEAR